MLTVHSHLSIYTLRNILRRLTCPVISLRIKVRLIILQFPKLSFRCLVFLFCFWLVYFKISATFFFPPSYQGSPSLHTSNVRESSVTMALPISLSNFGCRRSDSIDLCGSSSVKLFLPKSSLADGYPFPLWNPFVRTDWKT